MNNTVKILSSELLAPAKEIHNGGLKKMKLTLFDLCMLFVPYQKRILFYTPDSDTDVVRLLRESLAEVLVIFYPLAGRMSKGSDGGMEIDCTGDLSVRFNQAETNMTLKELGEFQPSDFCDSLCYLGSPPPTFPWTSDYPLLFIQVTKFACGGISIGVGFSHQVVDGVSAWHFITSWAEFARRGHISMLPQISYNYKPPSLSTEEIIEVGKRTGMLDERGHLTLTGDDKNPEKVVTKPFKLDTETIQKLKSDAGMGFSTFVVVCAYFWRKATLAKELPESNISRFFVLVNCRGRIKCLPKAYFGNACSNFMASTTVGNLKQGGISYAAGLLQDGIRAFDDEDTTERATALQKWFLENPDLFMSDGRSFMQAVGSIRHPVYESDFGFGKPVGVTFGNDDLHDGKIYLFPSADGNGATATLVLEPGTLERLEMNAS